MSQTDRFTGLVGYSGCKIPVRVATTANITLSGLQTIDGVALAQDDRVLVFNQTTASQNGIYVADSGSWNRAPDCDGPYDLVKGSLVFVTNGTTYGSNWFYCTTSSPTPDGSMSINFSRTSTALAVISAFWQGVLATTTAALARAALGISAYADGLVTAATAAAARAVLGIDDTAPFTTGDVKLTIKTVADTGWVLMNDTTIGNAVSGATGRANADTATLYALLWNNTANAQCAVSTGRGANAAADFAAGKTIALPKALGRALATYGAGSGLTARVLALAYGDENTQQHTHVLTDPGHVHTVTASNAAGASFQAGANFAQAGNTGSATTGITMANYGTGTAGNVQPTLFLNTMIKL